MLFAWSSILVHPINIEPPTNLIETRLVGGFYTDHGGKGQEAGGAGEGVPGEVRGPVCGGWSGLH